MGHLPFHFFQVRQVSLIPFMIDVFIYLWFVFLCKYADRQSESTEVRPDQQ